MPTLAGKKQFSIHFFQNKPSEMDIKVLIPAPIFYLQV